MSNLYKNKPDGIRRCQMLEIIIHLACLNFPEKFIDQALYSFLRQVMPKLQKKKTSEKSFLLKWDLHGRDAYRAYNLITPEVDTVLHNHKPLILMLQKRMHMKLHVKYGAIKKLFGDFYPEYKREIHICFLMAKRLVYEEREGREGHF